jgi:hypothetical protein
MMCDVRDGSVPLAVHDHCDKVLALRRYPERLGPGVDLVGCGVVTVDDVGDQGAMGLVFEKTLVALN